MKRYKTYNGEQPVFLDDFNFIQDATQDAIRMLANALMRNDASSCILWGCRITYTSHSIAWTDGLVMLAGEILPIRAGELPWVEDQSMYFQILETLDPAGERTYKDGSEHSCFAEREARISSVDSDFPLDEISSLEYLLKPKPDTLYYADNATGFTFGGRVDLFQSVAGETYLKGYMYNSSSVTVKTIFPKTEITAQWINRKDITPGKTVTTFAFAPQSSADTPLVVPAIIEVTEENGSYFVKGELAKETEFSPGQGNFYCVL
ncbi:MAG: hypothetical protein ACI3Y2_06775 [Candidatus Egerieousia sp.]